MHARVELAGELVEPHPIALQHHEQVVDQVARLVACLLYTSTRTHGIVVFTTAL